MSQPPGSIPTRLFRLAAPMIGLNVLSVLALAVDTAMCGRLPNADTVLAALSFSVQIVFLLTVMMIGLTVGTVALVARAYGGRDAARVNHLLAQSTLLTTGVAATVAVLGNLLARPMLELLGAPPEAIAEGLAYLRPLLTCAVFYYLNILYAAVFRGVGNTRLPFVIALITNIVNFVANYGLILGNFGLPALGVQGAAYGTVLSYAVGLGLYIYVLRGRNRAGLMLPVRPPRMDRGLARDLYRVGAPAALDMVILNVGFLAIIGMLGRIDEVAVAAHGVGLRVQALAFVPGLGVSQATSAMVGQALGAGRADEARQVVLASIALCTAIMTALACLIVFAAHPIIAIFDVADGTALETFTVTWMRVLGAGMPIVGVHIAFVGMLQGAGATNTSLAINAIATFAVQVPLGALLGFPLGLGALGIWLGLPLSFAVKAALSFGVYRIGRWAKVGLRT